jgi:hypothetical protein
MSVVIYHRADFDGLFCREIAQLAMPDAKLIGWDYGDAEPSIQEDESLFMLDLSVPGLMSHPKLCWIDHHHSAIMKYGSHIAGVRIDGVAACRLAWQYFIKHKTPTRAEYYDREVEEPLAVLRRMGQARSSSGAISTWA